MLLLCVVFEARDETTRWKEAVTRGMKCGRDSVADAMRCDAVLTTMRDGDRDRDGDDGDGDEDEDDGDGDGDGDGGDTAMHVVLIGETTTKV